MKEDCYDVQNDEEVIGKVEVHSGKVDAILGLVVRGDFGVRVWRKENTIFGDQRFIRGW